MLLSTRRRCEGARKTRRHFWRRFSSPARSSSSSSRLWSGRSCHRSQLSRQVGKLPLHLDVFCDTPAQAEGKPVRAHGTSLSEHSCSLSCAHAPTLPTPGSPQLKHYSDRLWQFGRDVKQRLAECLRPEVRRRRWEAAQRRQRAELKVLKMICRGHPPEQVRATLNPLPDPPSLSPQLFSLVTANLRSQICVRSSRGGAPPTALGRCS